MPHLMLGWRIAAYGAAALVLASVALAVLRPPGRLGRLLVGAVRECGIVLGLFAAWQFVGTLARHDATGAVSRGRDLLHAWAWLHLPTEQWAQGLVLGHPWAVKAANTFYLYAHFNGMIAFLAWMWLRHRGRYVRARTTVVLVTGASFLCHLVTVAPPRLLPGEGFVDTAARYGQSVYGPATAGIADQVSAFPSVHVAWAAIVGWYVWRLGSRAGRWLGPVHFTVTTLVVVVTANHYWFDGVAAVALLLAALALQAAGRAWLARRRTAPAGMAAGAPARADLPAEAAVSAPAPA